MAEKQERSEPRVAKTRETGVEDRRDQKASTERWGRNAGPFG